MPIFIEYFIMKIRNINYRLVTGISLTTILTGCVTGSDLREVQSQVDNLQRQVRSLEGQLVRSNEELVQTQGELAIVKKQRVVRLPTGAPTETRARSNSAPNYTASNEESTFNQAVNQYKSGDVQGAIRAFEQFNARYPDSAKRGQSLFYLGQAAYTVRDYTRAQQALEVLAFQPTNGQVNQPAVRLLKMVYQAQGNSADEVRLNHYLQTLSQSNIQSNVPGNTLTPTASKSATSVLLSSPSATSAKNAPIIESKPQQQQPQPLRPVITP